MSAANHSRDLLARLWDASHFDYSRPQGEELARTLRDLEAYVQRLEEQYKHLENELDDMTGQFCNEAIHLTRAEDRVRELEEQLEASEKSWDKLSRKYDELHEQLEAAQTALAPFSKAGKKLIHQGSQGYRNGTYDDQTETYTFRVGDVIAAYKIAGTSDPGDAPQSSAPQSDEPSGARGAPFPATNASEPVEATQGPSTDGNPSSHPGSEASVPAMRPE